LTGSDLIQVNGTFLNPRSFDVTHVTQPC